MNCVMNKRNKCDICGKTGRRLCPGIKGAICSACCGAKRNSEIRCSSDCSHSPFSTTGYDLWLRIDAGLSKKYMEYTAAHYSKDEFEEVVEDMSFGDMADEHSFTVAAGAAAYNLLFVEQDKHGKTLTDKWESEGWEGLNNDEKVMMCYLKTSRVTIVEIQKILDHQAMECIDILEPGSKPFILFDRATASRAVRFSKMFTWLTHFPNFSRASHGGIEITDFISNEFMDIIKQDTKKEAKKAGFKLKDYLSENFGEYCQLTIDLALEKRKAVFSAMDMHQCVATYDIKGRLSDIEAILEKYPEFRWEDKDPEEGDPANTLYYSWLRRGESKAIEKEMNPAFCHEDESMGVGGLGNIRLYPDKLTVEVFTKQKYEFAKKMVMKYFGSLVVLRNEKVVDIAKQIANKPVDERAEKSEKEQVFMSPEDEQALMQKVYEQQYKKFIDENIPMIDNNTPRQAAKNPKLRPKLVELMKVHIKGIEQLNKEKGIKVNIDWILDELGLSELI